MRWSMTRSWILAIIGVALACVTGLSLVGCGAGGNPTTAGPVTSLGEPPDRDVSTVCAACLTEEKLGQTVAVEGEAVQQCPASGCWFRMKDEVGEVFVDLNPAKLRLTEKREGQHARVTGRVAKQGGKFRLEARHVEFTPAKKDAPSGEN